MVSDKQKNIEGTVQKIGEWKKKWTDPKDNVAYGSRGIQIGKKWHYTGLLTQDRSASFYAGISVGDIVTLEIEANTKGYDEIKEIDKTGVGEVIKDNPNPNDGMTDEDVLLGRVEMAYRISKKAIDNECPEVVKACLEFNPGALMDAIEKTAVSVFIEMGKTGM